MEITNKPVSQNNIEEKPNMKVIKVSLVENPQIDKELSIANISHDRPADIGNGITIKVDKNKPFNPLTSSQTSQIILNKAKNRYQQIGRKILYKIYNHLFFHRLWILITLAVQGALISSFYIFDWKKSNITFGTLSVANLLFDVIIRNELFINFLHRIVVKIPFFKYFFNRMLHSIGGLHVGLAISITILLFIDIIVEGLYEKSSHLFNKISSLLILMLLGIIMVTALPAIRRKNHNLFEKFHRYVGWFTLFLLLSHLIMSDILVLGKEHIYKSPNLYMIIFIIFIVFLPWLFVRKVDISLKSPSSQCTVLTVSDIRQIRFHGRALKISKNLKEWHAFAVALSYPASNEIKIVIASAGDWTKDIIKRSKNENENKKLDNIWLRMIFSTGFMYSINAYKNVFIIATGSGIAPVLPYIQVPIVQGTVFWIAKDHLGSFGEDLIEIVKQSSQNIIMHDTRNGGRPKIEYIFEKFKDSKAEAIFVVSNEEYTNQVINSASKHGILCYGALFDS